MKNAIAFLFVLLLVGCSTPDPLTTFNGLHPSIPGRKKKGSCAPFAEYTANHLRFHHIDAHVLSYKWVDKTKSSGVHAIAVWQVKKKGFSELWTVDNMYHPDVPLLLCKESTQTEPKDLLWWQKIIEAKLDRACVAVLQLSP